MNCVNVKTAHALPSPRRRLLGFVLFSATLHGLLLSATLLMRSPENVLLGEDTLRVQMETRPGNGTVHNVRNFLSAQSDRHLNDTPRETRDNLVSNRTETESPTDHSASDSQTLQNYLRGILQSELSHHLRYPRLARERGWQGTALVAVMVAPDGTLIATRLLRSSGHALLDEASLTGLSHVHSLPLQAAARLSHPVEVILPIQFRLIDNT
jgi:TonB family protein